MSGRRVLREVGRLSLRLFAGAIGALVLLAVALFLWHALVAGLPMQVATEDTATQVRVWVFVAHGWRWTVALALLYSGCLAVAWGWIALRARMCAKAGQ
jgi:hypothetical protein